MNFFPLAQPFLFILFFLVVLLIISVQIGILGFVYERIGVSQAYIFSLLVLSLLGSYVNIPITELDVKQVVPPQEVSFFGVRYIVPEAVHLYRTIVAVNIGGAVIPTLLSLYLLLKQRLFWQAGVAIIIVATLVNFFAYPVRGVGIAVPTFVPPVVAAVVALVLARRNAAPLAYICGSVGTLIGADLLNLHRLPALGAPVASIGGAGTFDGIFLSGILAVLLASVFQPTHGK